MKRDLAEKIMREMMDIGEHLNAAGSLAEKIDNIDERKNFKAAIGNIMSLIYTEIMIPTIKQHRDLDPNRADTFRQ